MTLTDICISRQTKSVSFEINCYLQTCSARDSATRELKDIQAKIQKERELFKAQEKDHIERIEKHKQQAEKLATELCGSKTELENANRRISELQREFTNKQKEFTAKLDKYLHGN